VTGRSTQGKLINLSQLQGELVAASVQVAGLGLHDDSVYTYAADGSPADFPASDQPTVDQVIADHVAMRDKTDAEYSAEFQTASPERRQEIRDMTAGLLPREQVPMSESDLYPTI
jgi:hypothetical protein